MNSEYPHPLRSDTGLWHLTVYLGARGISAWLDLKDHPEAPSRMLLSERWARDDEHLLERIENCIYDHPEVLDDYSASIIIEAPRSLPVPEELLSEEGAAEVIYNKVYTARGEDVLADTHSSPETVLFSLTPGLKGFLSRTFPGSRIYSHLGRLKQQLRPGEGTGHKVFINLRPEEVDILAFDGSSLLCAATQPLSSWSDAAYLLFNLLEVYELDPASTEVAVSGEENEELRKLAQSRVKSYTRFWSPLLPGIGKLQQSGKTEE